MTVKPLTSLLSACLLAAFFLSQTGCLMIAGKAAMAVYDKVKDDQAETEQAEHQ